MGSNGCIWWMGKCQEWEFEDLDALLLIIYILLPFPFFTTYCNQQKNLIYYLVSNQYQYFHQHLTQTHQHLISLLYQQNKKYIIKTNGHKKMKKTSSSSTTVTNPLSTSCQLQKDMQALENTKKVVADQHNQKRQYKRWVPQSINSQNAIFSSVPVQHKPMKKQSGVPMLSINIFEAGEHFKPCVKRTQYSTRNSGLFTLNQSTQAWKSSSKKVEARKSGDFTPKRMLRQSQNHNAKCSTIDLSWSVNPVQNQRNAKSRSIYSRLQNSSIRF